MHYKNLFFDLDDTLFDFQRSEYWALERVFQLIGLDYNDETRTTYLEINHKLWRSYEQGKISSKQIAQTRFTKLIEQYELAYDGVVADQQFRKALVQANFLLPHAEELLETVSKTHRIFALTNGVAETQKHRLRETKIEHFFEKIYISELMGTNKPERSFFDYVFKHSPDLKKEECLMIGDNIATDIIGGQHYGLDTCWINPQQKQKTLGAQPTYEITRLQDLYDII